MSTYGYSMEAPVSEPPRRVVSLVPSVTESLFDLNLGRYVVGVTQQCVHPANMLASVPRVGLPEQPDIDVVRSLQPDLVIASVEVNSPQTIALLQAAQIPVWVTFPRTVAEAINLLWNIMHVFDEAAMVPRVRLIEQTLDWVAGISRSYDRLARVFAPITTDPFTTANAETYQHDLLSVCGGSNVFGGRADRYSEVSIDDVRAARPEVILLPDTASASDELALANCVDGQGNPARLYRIDPTLLNWPGTRVAYALNTLPALLAAEGHHGR
jgi:ABC-type Fe3+-hydroxamate transport system substrate-binding protein